MKDVNVASIERFKTKLGRKTVLNFSVRYAYFIPTFIKKPSKKPNNEDIFEYDDKGLLKPLVVDLKTGEAVEDESIYNIEENPARYCPIASNSRDNPVRFDYFNKLRSVTVINYISILEYKDTGNVCITFIETETCWVRSTGRVFNNNSVVYKLTIRHGAKTTLTKDGLLLLTNEQIIKAIKKIIPLMRTKYIARYRGYVILRKVFIKHFMGVDKMSAKDFDLISYGQLVTMYRVKQNAKLHQLPWSEEDLASIYRTAISINSEAATEVSEGERSVANVKVSLNRYLRRGDTKKAIEACFYGFAYPKSIKRVLLKTKPLEFKYKDYENIKTVIERYGVDNARNLFTHGDGSPNKDMIGNPYYMEMLELGFSFAQVRRSNRTWMKDTLDMRRRLLQEGFAPEFNPNIRDYHNYLMALVIEIDREQNANRAARNAENRREWEERRLIEISRRKRLELGYSSIDTSEQVTRSEIDNYIFRSPVNAAELSIVGSRLKICVGMYKEDFFLKRLDIVLVTTITPDGKEKYIACLEIRGKSVVQAKLNSNRPVSANNPLMRSIRAWMLTEKIKVATDDILQRWHEYVDYNLPNKERIEFLQECEIITEG